MLNSYLFRNFECLNIDNFSGVKNRKIDKLIVQGRETLNRIDREKIYHDLSLQVEKEAVTVEILHARGHYWLNPCVRGFEPNVLSHVYTDYRPIEIDAECLNEREKKSAL